uniref:GRIP domain-containing protein n=1 Tax=Labrus bergylta TaxID=56723 RepID=A0A3Q3MLQ6_9LABR
MVGKLHSLEEDNRECKHKLESQREEFEKAKDEILKSKEESVKETEERLSAESARKVSELKKKAEQKIGQIKKQLTSQLEEKEQSIKALQAVLEELKSNETSGKQTLEEKTKAFEDTLVKLQEEQEKEIEQILSKERLQREKSLEELKSEYEEKLSTLQRDAAQRGDSMENHSMMQEEVDGDALETLKNNLSQVKNEKDKIQKDFTRLQKDIRSLRKEHEQDLEHMKKELLEENEKRMKLELEDVEMKHNSALKQLMREFNTQMALKEKELDTGVKETIAKAQSVEAELLSIHREEASQLKKLIAQKEDDLHRTVQKYEQVLQAQLAEKTTLLSEARLKEQGFVERVSVELRVCAALCVWWGGGTNPGFTDALSEATEVEYLRKVLFEYMMGRETKTMAKVLTSMLKFPPDQAQKVLEKEDSKTSVSIR